MVTWERNKTDFGQYTKFDICAAVFCVCCYIGKLYFKKDINEKGHIKYRRKNEFYGKMSSICSKCCLTSGVFLIGIAGAYFIFIGFSDMDKINEKSPTTEAPELANLQDEIEEDSNIKEEPDTTDDAVDTQQTYKMGFSRICVLGLYDFGDKITAADLQNFDNMYIEYWKDDASRWKIDIPTEDHDSSTVNQRIDEFDQKKMNMSDTLTASDYILNAEDRIYTYTRTENIHMLEQAGISAEGAVEVEVIAENGDYSDMFYDIFLATNCFCYVLAQNPESYDSGTAGDVKYRVGKIMYKPFLNLKELDRNKQLYSLCCAHVFLKDAFNLYNEMTEYSIETAYYYTVNCKDIVGCMLSDDIEFVAQECSRAYTRFLELGLQHPDNLTFVKYKDEAKKAYDYVESCPK